jgi:hypothetical protein
MCLLLSNVSFFNPIDGSYLVPPPSQLQDITQAYSSSVTCHYDGTVACCVQPFAHAPATEALRALLNLDLALECDGKSVH